MKLPIISLPIEHEQDVVLARRRARQIAELVHFDAQDQARIATAVSEIARNAYAYAGGGRAEFMIDKDAGNAAFVIRISDNGPGIPDLNAILDGRYQSKTGMGLGIIGARRLMDRVEIDTAPGRGTTVCLRKELPQRVPELSPRSLAGMADRLTQAPHDVFEEVRKQNQDLLRALEDVRQAKTELERRQEELIRLNRELEDTNRGVVALYAELDERAERLRNADAMKSRFLSYMSHEFRTPLNGIVGLTRLLLDRQSVQHDSEASKQVRFIEKASEELAEMVNDLLDLAKVEAGKLTVQAIDFTVDSMIGTLRGLFRPFQSGPVALAFDVVGEIPLLHTDETKLAQITRNLLSNALKFTEQGEVRLTVTHDVERDGVIFSVKDTGIGIPLNLQAVIFDEFSQVESPLQKKTKGTGLGLPLCKRLCELLGGSISVSSAPREGSLFVVSIPRVYGATHGEHRRKVLIVDDEEISRYLLRTLIPTRFDILEANGGAEGLRLAKEWRPDIVLLDLMMPGVDGYQVLNELRRDPSTREIPVVISTAYAMNEVERDTIERLATAVLNKDILAKAESLTFDFGPPVSVAVRASVPKQIRVS